MFLTIELNYVEVGEHILEEASYIMMDTQAMTYGGKSTPSDIQTQRDRLPDVKPKQINLISDALKAELKDLINEVLDERV